MGTDDTPKYLVERSGASTRAAAPLMGHETLEHEGTIYQAGAARESPIDLRGRTQPRRTAVRGTSAIVREGTWRRP